MGVAGSDISSVPKVSVIIPAYNSGKYISGCLQSLTGQTLQEIEIIAVNDGSTDDTLKIIESFAGKDNRIKVINQSRQMRGAAGNNGMKAASGEYIALADPDICFDADYFEKLFKTAKKYDADIALASCERTENGKVKKLLSIAREELVNSLQDKVDICRLAEHPLAINKIYRKSMLTKHKTVFPERCFYEDNIFTVKAIYYANAVAAVPGTCCYQTSSMKHKRTPEMIEDEKSAKRAVLDFLESQEADIRDGEFMAVKKEINFKGINIYRHEKSLASEKISLFGITVFNIEIL
ncbi:MAG: glycosyltransferase family 2 protein [Lentisphaerae bacterium]|nr:glycosyltransferase family 2 protein [Lentisphaerota bacterium]